MVTVTWASSLLEWWMPSTVFHLSEWFNIVSKDGQCPQCTVPPGVMDATNFFTLFRVIPCCKSGWPVFPVPTFPLGWWMPPTVLCLSEWSNTDGQDGQCPQCLPPPCGDRCHQLFYIFQSDPKLTVRMISVSSAYLPTGVMDATNRFISFRVIAYQQSRWPVSRLWTLLNICPTVKRKDIDYLS